MLPVAKHPFVIFPALLVLVQYPERDTDIGGDKQFPRKNDNGFHFSAAPIGQALAAERVLYQSAYLALQKRYIGDIISSIIW